jgi:hypothetical protein
MQASLAECFTLTQRYVLDLIKKLRDETEGRVVVLEAIRELGQAGQGYDSVPALVDVMGRAYANGNKEIVDAASEVRQIRSSILLFLSGDLSAEIIAAIADFSADPRLSTPSFDEVLSQRSSGDVGNFHAEQQHEGGHSNGDRDKVYANRGPQGRSGSLHGDDPDRPFIRRGCAIDASRAKPGGSLRIQCSCTPEPLAAAGYNKRATVLFLMQDFAESIEDCLRVLELEPFHFGALSGMGLCHLRMEDQLGALHAFERTLQVDSPAHTPGKNVSVPLASHPLLPPRSLDRSSVWIGGMPLLSSLLSLPANIAL